MHVDFDVQEMLFDYVDQVKELLSPQIWKNVLLDCSKNELLTIWIVYRRKEVNMTAIAEYIHVPLNTATGIVSRLEKKDYIIRNRNKDDKRIVTIQLGQKGTELMDDMMHEFTFYLSKLMTRVSPEEFKTLLHIMDQVKLVMEQGHEKETKPKKVTKIVIE